MMLGRTLGRLWPSRSAAAAAATGVGSGFLHRQSAPQLARGSGLDQVKQNCKDSGSGGWETPPGTTGAAGAGIPRPISVLALDWPGGRAKLHRLHPVDAHSLIDVGIRRPFNTKNDVFRQHLRHFLHQLSELQKNGTDSRVQWNKLSERNLLGITIPAEYGGPGGNLLDLSILLEEQCYGLDPCPTLWLHEAGARYILRHGSEQQKDAILPELCSGDTIMTICTTDLACREGATSMQCAATRVQGGWQITGRVMTPHDVISELLLLPAATQPGTVMDESDMTGMTLFLVKPNPDLPGLRKEIVVHDMNNRTLDSTVYYFDDYFLPEDSILSDLNDGYHVIRREYITECFCVAIRNISFAEKMFETTRNIINGRETLKRNPVINMQSIHEKMGEMKSDISIMRMAMDNTLENGGKDGLKFHSAAMFKSRSTELEINIASDCLQLLSGSAQVWESELALDYSRASRNRIWSTDKTAAVNLIGSHTLPDPPTNIT